MKKLLYLILNYRSPVLTRNVEGELNYQRILSNLHDKVDIRSYSAKDRNAEPYAGSYDQIENKGFTKNWNNILSLVINEGFTHFCLSNNDIVPDEYYLENLCDHMDSDFYTAPFNSPYSFLRPSDAFSTVPFVEFTAPVISLETLEKVGFLDERFSMGYGVDYDYSIRCIENGIRPYVLPAPGFDHLEHRNMVNKTQYIRQAVDECRKGMEKKYGKDWRKRLDFKVPI